ncbi:hypothetical protein GN956_G21868 [Arapaima gigas]
MGGHLCCDWTTVLSVTLCRMGGITNTEIVIADPPCAQRPRWPADSTRAHERTDGARGQARHAETFRHRRFSAGAVGTLIDQTVHWIEQTAERHHSFIKSSDTHQRV